MALMDMPGRRARQPGAELSRLGPVAAPLGNAHPNIVPYQVFRVADGHIIIAAGNDRQTRDFCRILGLDGLADEARFRTNADRVANRPDFVARLEAACARFPAAALLAALEAAAVPAGPINTVAEVFSDPQVIARGLRLDLPATGAAGGTVPSVRAPIMIDGEPMAAPTRRRGSASIPKQFSPNSVSRRARSGRCAPRGSSDDRRRSRGAARISPR